MTEANEASKSLLDEARTAWDYQTSGMGWNKWVAVGKGLEECRRQAFARSNTNDMKRQAAKKAMTAILETERLDKIDGGDRSVLLAIMAQLPAITKWRDALTTTERMRYNHPRTVMAQFKRAIKMPPPEPDPAAEAVTPAPRGYKAQFQIAEAKISELKQQLHTAQTKGSLIDLQFDPPEQIARVVLGNVDAKRAESIGFAIVQALRDPPPKADAIRNKKATRADQASHT